MKTFFKHIYNFILLLLMLIDALILMPINLLVFVIVYPFDPKRTIIHKMSHYWGLHYIWFNPLWKIEHKCYADIDTKKSYIIVSNHQSMFDICVMYKVPLVFKWVSKQDVFKIPFVGWLLKLHGDILIKRGDTQSTKVMFKHAEKWIKRGCSIAIFPEGTRSKSGKIQSFKEGAFLLAKMNKLPIIPVVVEGTRDMFPTGKLSFGGRATAHIHVLPVISAETVVATKTKDLSNMVHQMILDEHKKIVPEWYSE